MLTRVDQASISQLDEITARVRCHTSAPVLHVEFRPTGLMDSRAHSRPVTSAGHNPVYLVSAIGNPDAFARSCQSAGLQITGRHDFPDHHKLSAAEWNHVDDCARNAGATAIVMTLKDLVKLPAPPDAEGSANNTPERLALMITATLPRPEDSIALDHGLEIAIGPALRIAMPPDGDRPAQQS
jgi:tetraacyldisaccharide-1-P 4'-kinase